MQKLPKWIVPVLLIVLVLIIGIGVAGKKDTEEAETWESEYDLGVRLLAEGKYEEAILAFEAAIKIDPKQPTIYLALSDVYGQMGDMETALEILRRGYDETGDGALKKKMESLKPSEENTQEPEKETEPVTEETTTDSAIESEIPYIINLYSEMIRDVETLQDKINVVMKENREGYVPDCVLDGYAVEDLNADGLPELILFGAWSEFYIFDAAMQLDWLYAMSICNVQNENKFYTVNSPGTGCDNVDVCVDSGNTGIGRYSVTPVLEGDWNGYELYNEEDAFKDGEGNVLTKEEFVARRDGYFGEGEWVKMTPFGDSMPLIAWGGVEIETETIPEESELDESLQVGARAAEAICKQDSEVVYSLFYPEIAQEWGEDMIMENVMGCYGVELQPEGEFDIQLLEAVNWDKNEDPYESNIPHANDIAGWRNFTVEEAKALTYQVTSSNPIDASIVQQVSVVIVEINGGWYLTIMP